MEVIPVLLETSNDLAEKQNQRLSLLRVKEIFISMCQPLWKDNFGIRMVAELIMISRVLFVLRSLWLTIDHSTVGSGWSAVSTHHADRTFSVLSFQCIHIGLAREVFLSFTFSTEWIYNHLFYNFVRQV